MSKPTRADVLADLARASQQVNAANKALEAAQRVAAEYDQTDEGRAEQWLLDHNIDVYLARDNEDNEIQGQYVLETAEILSLAERLMPKPAADREDHR